METFIFSKQASDVRVCCLTSSSRFSCKVPQGALQWLGLDKTQLRATESDALNMVCRDQGYLEPAKKQQ